MRLAMHGIASTSWMEGRDAGVFTARPQAAHMHTRAHVCGYDRLGQCRERFKRTARTLTRSACRTEEALHQRLQIAAVVPWNER
jgi:hypothetical protein